MLPWEEQVEVLAEAGTEGVVGTGAGTEEAGGSSREPGVGCSSWVGQWSI